jgi:hypothetical protein
VFDPKTGQHNTTNQFHYTYELPDQVPKLFPKTYDGNKTNLSKVHQLLKFLLPFRGHDVSGWTKTFPARHGSDWEVTCDLRTKIASQYLRKE